MNHPLTAADRLALLGPDLVAELRAEGACAPPPSPRLQAELVAVLRRRPSLVPGPSSGDSGTA